MDDHPIFRSGYVVLAALAGAVTALAFAEWRTMSKWEIMLTLFVGASFAIFVTPWLAQAVLGITDTEVRTLAGLTYISASGSNILIPMLIRWMGRAFGHWEKP